MDMQSPEPEDLLSEESFLRFCRGEGREDTLFWQHWISRHPEKHAVVSRAGRLLDILSAGQGNRGEQLGMLKDALARREQFAALIAQRPVQAGVYKFKAIWRYAAAAILIAAGITAYIRYHHQDNHTWTLTRYEYTTAGDSRQTVVLPDNSVVMLNKNSHLSISRNFREVTLSGEAFFDIKHDAVHPFVVHTNDYKIRVLGTSFNVRSYPGAKRTETDLITGKVEIARDTSERVILRPKQKFVLERKAAAGHAPEPVKWSVAGLHVDTLTHHIAETAWAHTKLIFKNETLEQIAGRLQAWYGIKISFTGEAVKRYRYTASFDDETIFKALQYLQQSYPFIYKVEQDSIIISESKIKAI